MKYGIAIFPSKKLQDKVNSLRKRYDPHYALIPPHITLKTPFEIEDSKYQTLLNKLRLSQKKQNLFILKWTRLAPLSL